MKKLAHTDIIERSKYYLDMSDNLLNRIDLFLCNTDLTQHQKEALMKLFEESYSEGYVNSISD
jgi:hypothetical protein